jgi:hypothetical protein
MLQETVDVYLDGGPTPGPTPSTIVDATGTVLRVVRVGVISVARLREVVPSIEAPDDLDEPELFEGFASPGSEGDERADGEPPELPAIPEQTLPQAYDSDGGPRPPGD